jgi:hypothetical protein
MGGSQLAGDGALGGATPYQNWSGPMAGLEKSPTMMGGPMQNQIAPNGVVNAPVPQQPVQPYGMPNQRRKRLGAMRNK